MGQTRLYLTAPRAEAERVYAALEAEFEADDHPLGIFEIDEEREIHEVSIYVEDGVEAVEARFRRLAGDLEVLREVLPDVDWVAKSLEGLKPVRAGPFLVHGSHDRGERRPGDLAIEIEAGLAFGTGHHGTTAGCLEMIADVVAGERPRNALDLGAGSAVLAIGIAKLARVPVLATDIDPVAVEVAEQNVRLNGVANLVETAVATGFDNSAFAAWKPFDLIVANILARPLMDLAPDMARHVSAGGSLILSGILAAQRDAVLAAYEAASFRHIRTIEREGWVTLHLKG